MPAEIDGRILDDARRAMRRSGARFRLGRPVLAAAAVLALALSVPVLVWTRSRTVTVPATRVALAGDLDGDGRVDIVDAMVLAGAVERREGAPMARDINADGVVDRSDVNALALLAVRLDGGGS